MEVKPDIARKIEKLVDWYRSEAADACPSQTQWTQILSLPEGKPVTLINFFKFREKAAYQSEQSATATGDEAFNRYASVSIPTMEKVGGKFLHVGPFAGTFLGENEDWDLVAIGSYPDLDALYALYSDEDYRQAFHHRSAAVLRQKVVACSH
ncbi:DUF1330 domain-containing protein [Labrenzia sp. CE80]|uniref:DUF1330 domain-containing protein n=1 Tax=Labrenzia sp. CE80 TaxID=1788986 RepID=UPI00129B2713|nr:DUF1330 domain-containing protein [Labrenzia sp. CE80]